MALAPPLCHNDAMTEIDPAHLTHEALAALLADALLAHAPFDGWTAAARDLAAVDVGVTPERAALTLPTPRAMIEAWFATLDAQFLAQLAESPVDQLKVRQRIALLIQRRLEAKAPHREALRRALGVLGLPGNAGHAARILWRSADLIWRAAGDTATDFNHYTKRATLSGVYASTLLVWLGDSSEGYRDTWAFLDRRIADVMRIEKLKGRMRTLKARLPRPLSLLGRLRYPA